MDVEPHLYDAVLSKKLTFKTTSKDYVVGDKVVFREIKTPIGAEPRMPLVREIVGIEGDLFGKIQLV